MSSVRNSETASMTGWLQRPLIAGLLATLSVMLIAAVAILSYTEKQSTNEAQRQANRLGDSVQVLLTPLMLSDDRVSMNFIANQLVSDPVLSGLKLTDTQQLTMAVAGSPSDYRVTREIAPNGDPLGELTLWVDPVPGMQALKTQLLLTLIAFLLALIAGTIVYRLLARVKPEPEPAQPFSETLAQELGEPESQDIEQDSSVDDSDQPIDLNDVISTAEQDESLTQTTQVTDNIEPADSQPHSTAESEAHPDEPEKEQSQSKSLERLAEDTDAPISFADLNPGADDELVQSHLESWLNDSSSDPTDNLDSLSVHQTLQTPEPDVPTLKSYVPENNEEGDVDLIELLRPEPQPDSMPKFKPTPMLPDDAELIEEPESEEIEITMTPPVESGQRSRRLPIITEEQLDLYTLEQELDLMLPALDAGYLILIDTTSMHSAHLELEEAKQIRRTYRTLANSVARIYHGDVTAIGDDLEIRFDQPQPDDSHGVNAVCAALLFNILYRSYNQSRIRQMAPVLNLHIALVRGQNQRFTQMLDEARFLTRSTQTNHLISHTALTEAPDLKSSLLNGADVRREDEDKVLLLKVEKKHQALLEKQARYLLAKLADRTPKS